MTLTLLPVRQERVVHKPYIYLGGLQVLDVLTTGLILAWFTSDGEATEGNPLAAAVFDHAGLLVGLVTLLAFKLAAVALFWDCQTKVRLVTAIYGLVIFNNALFLGLGVYKALS